MIRALIILGLLLPATPLLAHTGERFIPVYTGAAFRPKPRPWTQDRAAQVRAAVDQAMAGLGQSPRPAARVVEVVPAPQSQGVVARAVTRVTGAGRVCGDSGIVGTRIKRIKGKLRGCGIAKPVRVTAVDGVALSTPATMDCQTAQTLRHWVQNSLRKSIGRRGGGPAALSVAASYSCRSRNNQPGAKISEHGKGHAIDIAAVTLRDGSVISVAEHWGKGKRGRILAAMHKGACGPFGTVLGPNADRHHRDHFHFDTARYRKGSYCR